MADNIRLRAVRAWRNAEHEGDVEEGDTITADEQRARDLETAGLAVREVEPEPEPAKEAPPAEVHPPRAARKDR